MLNQSDFRQPFRKRGLTPTLQIERERPAETQATNRDALLGSGTSPEVTAMELIIELEWIGRIVREIERELSLWDASEARGDSRAN